MTQKWCINFKVKVILAMHWKKSLEQKDKTQFLYMILFFVTLEKLASFL